MSQTQILIPQERIENKILLIRSQKVMLDKDLAILYGVETKQLKRAVKRNIDRFPEDFMFKLTKEEAECSRCQFDTLNRGKNIKYLPYVFTEHGILMLSSVLNSERAIQVNIQIMRAFTKMRQMIADYQELKQKIESVEKKFDQKFKINSIIFEEVIKDIESVKLLLEPKKLEERQIGFRERKKK